MKLQTPVIDEKCKVSISYHDKILMLGSCFSDNIGRQLADYGFDVCINPFGTLYNPVSILQSIRRLRYGTSFSTDDCVQIGAGDERWCTFSHHTSFAREDKEEFLADAEKSLSDARRFFLECNRIVITLGTSWCFRHIEKDFIVSNCLKHPAKEFVRERLSMRMVSDALKEIAGICSTCETPKQIIFTVSPIRHFKDGAHGNQLSKAALLLGIDDVLGSSCVTGADYFPAYEIVMDELRDYRFYAEDMCHPTDQTTCYIRDRFLDWALPESEKGILQENIRSSIHARHRKM